MEARGDGGKDEAGQIVKNKFYDFILESPSAEENDTTTLQQRLMIDYRAQISSMIQNDKTTLFVSYQHLKEFDYELMEGRFNSSQYHHHLRRFTFHTTTNTLCSYRRRVLSFRAFSPKGTARICRYGTQRVHRRPKQGSQTVFCFIL